MECRKNDKKNPQILYITMIFNTYQNKKKKIKILKIVL